MELCTKNGISLLAPALPLCGGINNCVGKYAWQRIFSAGGTCRQPGATVPGPEVRAVHSGLRNPTWREVGAPQLWPKRERKGPEAGAWRDSSFYRQEEAIPKTQEQSASGGDPAHHEPVSPPCWMNKN